MGITYKQLVLNHTGKINCMRTSWLYICSLGLYFFPMPSRSKLDLRANCFAIACSTLALDANAELLSDETLDARDGGFGFTRGVEVDAWSSKDFGGARSAAVEEDDEAKMFVGVGQCTRQERACTHQRFRRISYHVRTKGLYNGRSLQPPVLCPGKTETAHQ